MIYVVKIGGAPGNKLEPLVDEIAARTKAGEKWVIAHGASGVMNQLCYERGMQIRMVTSPSGYRSRFVGEKERELFREAALSYGAKISNMLIERGAKVCQMDPEVSSYATAKRKDFLRESVNGRIRIIRGNYSGTVTKINIQPIMEALDRGEVAIVPPLALDGELNISLNVDGDRMAAQIASSAGAQTLIILSNVAGLLKDINDPQSLIKRAVLADWEIVEHYAEGNMKRKIVACKEALELGVKNIYLADGRAVNPLANAMEGNSTWLTR